MQNMVLELCGRPVLSTAKQFRAAQLAIRSDDFLTLIVLHNFIKKIFFFNVMLQTLTERLDWTLSSQCNVPSDVPPRPTRFHNSTGPRQVEQLPALSIFAGPLLCS